MGRAESRFITVDGLRLHGLDYRPDEDTGRTPVVCLPGLTRPAMDFDVLARRLAFDGPAPRRVLALDYRGRGRSDRDPDPSRYDLATERGDLLAFLAAEGIAAAHFVGTSRGGLHIMALAAAHRDMIRSAVLNDIGPVIEAAGLRRIKGYVGRMVAPRTLEEATALLRIGSGQGFEGLSAAEWRIFVTTTFGDDPSDLRLRYDPALARTLDAFDLDAPLPESWPLFDALESAPVLTIRGENSDILSDATFAAMVRRWPRSEGLLVRGQAHAPLLADLPTLDRIEAFLAVSD